MSKPAQKTYESWVAKGYQTAPKVCFIIQSHNAPDSVRKIVAELRAYPNAEIIVIDDGSRIAHGKLIAEFLTRANEFIIRANDLYEVITYNRALAMTAAPFACLLQDDDLFPGLQWVNEGIALLRNNRMLAILGGRDGVRLLQPTRSGSGIRGQYKFDGRIGERENSFKFEVQSAPKGKSFRYVQTVNRAPMWINVELFRSHLKYIDQSYSPFQWDDAELCLRAYRSGLSVGWYDAGFRRCALGDGGMRIWNQKLHERQDEVNARKLYDTYGCYLHEIDAIVEHLNIEMK